MIVMLVYFFIGTIWSWWLEKYTTSNLDGIYGQPWIWKERVFHICLWPWSLGRFVYELLKQIKNQK